LLNFLQISIFTEFFAIFGDFKNWPNTGIEIYLNAKPHLMSDHP